MVIRNHKGQIMGAMCKQVVFPLQALEEKAKAAEAGILLAWDLGLKNIVVEGDAQLVTQALKGVDAPTIPILKIVEGSRIFFAKVLLLESSPYEQREKYGCSPTY